MATFSGDAVDRLCSGTQVPRPPGCGVGLAEREAHASRISLGGEFERRLGRRDVLNVLLEFFAADEREGGEDADHSNAPTYEPPTESCVKYASPPASSVIPTTSTRLTPIRVTSCAATVDHTIALSAIAR